MIVVVDTNVLVSGMLSSLGASAMIVERLARGLLHACYDPRILSEYREVLFRPRFRLDAKAVEFILRQIEQGGLLVASLPLAVSLPDPDDDMFLEAAIAGSARCIITGDLKDFPASRCGGVSVETPARAVKLPDFP